MHTPQQITGKFAHVQYWINGIEYAHSIKRSDLADCETGFEFAVGYCNHATDCFNDLVKSCGLKRIGNYYRIQIGLTSIWVFHCESGLEWEIHYKNRLVFSSETDEYFQSCLYSLLQQEDLIL